MSLTLVILMYAAWSAIFSIGKMVLQSSPPIFLTGSRMILAGIILLAYLFVRNRNALKINKKQLFPLLALALFSIYLTNILEFWGLQHLSAAKTCFIYSLSPFFASIFSYIHFGEKMNLQKLIGLLIGFGGFVPVLMLQTGSEELLNAFSFFSWPELAIMGAALFSVYGWVLLRIIVKNQTLSPMYANGYSMVFGGSMALVHSFFVDSWNPLPIKEGALLHFIEGITLMILVSNIICYNLYGLMLRKYTATFLSFVGLLSPFFASLNSWLLLKEPPSWTIFLSTVVVICGLFIVYRAELNQGYIVTKRAIDNKVEG